VSPHDTVERGSVLCSLNFAQSSRKALTYARQEEGGAPLVTLCCCSLLRIHMY
jgi:hypothetical protein